MEAIAHKTKKGFNLIEAAIVLAVVGGVIGGIWVAAATVIENHRVNKTVEGILTTARNIQNLISIQDAELIGDNVNITSALNEAGVFPKDWVSGSVVKNPFFIKGDITEVINLAVPVHSTRFFIRLGKVPQPSCIKLLVKISSIGAKAVHGQISFFDRINLGYIGTAGPPITYINSFPISLETAKIACNFSVVQMEFGFGYTRIN